MNSAASSLSAARRYPLPQFDMYRRTLLRHGNRVFVAYNATSLPLAMSCGSTGSVTHTLPSQAECDVLSNAFRLPDLADVEELVMTMRHNFMRHLTFTRFTRFRREQTSCKRRKRTRHDVVLEFVQFPSRDDHARHRRSLVVCTLYELFVLLCHFGALFDELAVFDRMLMF